MKVYRISRTERVKDLSGKGAKIYGGRWNSPGRPVLYCAENLSLAMLEILAHADERFLQRDFSAICLELSPKVSVKTLLTKELSPAWSSYPHSAVTQKLGDQWLKDEKEGVLHVPSAVNPLESNFLINPALLAESEMKIVEQHKISFDNRLML